MAIKEPEKGWWKPLTKDERLWIGISLAWMAISFVFMPIYHWVGAQNAPSTTYRVTAEEFDSLVEDMVAKYKVREEGGVPVVRPDPNEPVYLRARIWEWYPILELERDKTYEIHLSSMDLQHGFSLQPLNINVMVLPGFDYIMKLTPTTAGQYHIICNEYCGIGHHTMAGRLYII